MGNERRKFWRAAFNAPVKLVSDTATVHAMLDDISLKGALLEMPTDWHPVIGEQCRLTLQLGAGPDAAINMWGHISHAEGNRAGLTCESIDLDSITHLRRLVELNAGDPTLLERELSVLIS